MALIVSPTYRNLTSANGRDHTGWLIVTWALALEAGGFWRRKYQGDGLSAYRTSTSNLFTGNGGLGYLTGGAWGAGVGGANSISNPKAYIVMEEHISGTPTGRQAMIQRGTGTGAGTDRNVIVVFAWEPMTGSPAAATAPTAPTKSTVYATAGVNSAGDVIWQRLGTSPQMGGAGGTIGLNFWVCDAPSGVTEDVCPWAIEAYDSTADEAAIGVVYEALVDTPATCDHPCIAIMPVTNAGGIWEFAENKTTVSAVHDQAVGKPVKLIDPTDNATVVSGTLERLYNGTLAWPHSSVAASPLADIDGKWVKSPAVVRKTTGFVFAGVCESIKNIPGNNAIWPDTFHTAVADAVEPACLSWHHVTMPWEVGLARTGLTSADHTTVRGVLAHAPAPDLTDPELGTTDPAPASELEPEDSVTLTFTDDTLLAEVAIFATFTLGYERTECVYARGAFFPPYSGSDTVSDTEIEVEFSRDPGWPDDPTLTWVAVNGAGITVTGEVAYTVSEHLPSSGASP